MFVAALVSKNPRMLATAASAVLAGICLALFSAPPVTEAAECSSAPTDAVVDELGIDALHDIGLDGLGIAIGVISTSFDNAASPVATDAAADVASGALPGAKNPCGWTEPVGVLHDDVPADDEGRAMLQIVHSIAPAASLVFTTGGSPTSAVTGDQVLADAIDDMIAAGVDIIIDDMLLDLDTAYTAGLSAQAAERAAATGIAYVVAAGNYNYVGEENVDGAPQPSAGALIGSWQTSSYQATTCPAAVAASYAPRAVECLDFDPGIGEDPTLRYTLWVDPTSEPDTTVTLQWSDPPYAVESELIAFTLDDSGAIHDETYFGFPSVAGLPMSVGEMFFDVPDSTATTRDLVIARTGPALTEPLAVRFAFMSDDMPRPVVAAEYYLSEGDVTSGSSLIGRAANSSSIAVAAQPMSDPEYTLCDNWIVECFSTTGPSVRYFEPYPAVGVVPDRLSEPQRKTGPNITGLDGIPTTFFGDEVGDSWLYYGTSAATPVIGAVLALGMQAAPDVAIDRLVGALTSTAEPLSSPWVGPTDAEVVGAGLVQPAAFIESLVPTPAPSSTPTASSSVMLAESGSAPIPGWVGGGALIVMLAGVWLLFGRPRRA